MKRLLVVLLLLAVSGSAEARRKHKKSADSSSEQGEKKKSNKHDAAGTITLNGVETVVKWSDGDSFRIKDGEFKGSGTRLQGYNTLEAYGPVHRWGSWTPSELYEIAKSASQVAASESWKCTTDGKKDGYGRLLVDCPACAEKMVRTGSAMVYAVEGLKPRQELIDIQRRAMAAGEGIWAKGSTNGVISSLHSVGEDGDETDKDAYNRIVDTRTGEALKRKHQSTYKTCEEVCVDTDGTQSCMIYVPFSRRYKNQPDCLR